MSHAKRQALFNVGAKAVSRISGRVLDQYCCPLCENMFDRAALSDGTLTIEHVPPASQGGKGLVLTCRKCNTTAGSTVDAETHRRQEHYKFLDAMAGKGKQYAGRAKLTVENDNVNIQMSVHSETG